MVLPRLLPRDSLQLITGSYEKASDLGVIKFNERIELKTAEDMRVQFREALERGLPVPILTVINYLSHQEESFRWSVDYRRAGFFCQFFLTLTLISWAWMNIFFLVIPQHGAVVMITTGLLGLLAVFLYWILLPALDLVIVINGSVLKFKLDGCLLDCARHWSGGFVDRKRHADYRNASPRQPDIRFGNRLRHQS